MEHSELHDILSHKTADVYDRSGGSFAAQLSAFGLKEISIFTRNRHSKSEFPNVRIHPYRTTAEIVNCTSDVCFLDGDAIKVLFAKYPKNPQYVFVRLSFQTSWFLGFPGLLRRLLKGWLSFQGIALFSVNGESERWVVLKKTEKALSKKTLLFLPRSVGITPLLTQLRNRNINYVILRFFERLPELYREGGDFDLLVEDKDKEEIFNFFHEHQHLLSDIEEDIRFDVHLVSGGNEVVPYYPPPLARQILEHAIDGPAGSRVPAPEDAFLSFVYHALYHKGYDAGIPSGLPSARVQKNPENDYGGVIKSMATALRIPLQINMESLDEFMESKGWRPHLDTLAKISERNAWVYHRFFAEEEEINAIGLVVLIVKERAYQRGIVDDVIRYMKKRGFAILQTKHFTDTEKEHATNHLRGGNWMGIDGHTEGLLPELMIVAIDTHCEHLSPVHVREYERLRIRRLKNELRSRFDREKTSTIHSTDCTRESWQYIETCLPEQVVPLREAIRKRSTMRSYRSAWKRFLSLAYVIYRLRYFIRESVVQRFIQ